MVDKCEVEGAKILEPYNCILNLANIDNNNNKFYIIQIAEAPNDIFYYCTRHGRTGQNGVGNRQQMSKDSAIISFTNQFKSKTGITWHNRDNIEPRSGKYAYMKLHGKTQSSPTTIMRELNVKTDDKKKLPQNVATFLSPICSRKLIEEGMLQKLEIDISKMPLGNIDKSQLDKAEAILKEINILVTSTSTYMRTPDQNQRLSSLSSSYWTLIPKATKTNQPLPIIKDINTIETLADQLNDLRNIQIAGATLGKNSSITKVYDDMKLQIIPLESGERRMLEYLCTTSARMHGFKAEMVNGMRIKKGIIRELDTQKVFKNTPNHMYLFHGSISANWMGILSAGLRIPTQEQVSNGAILGQGCYFANCITKSANYCRLGMNETGYILVCEVAVGKSWKCMGPDNKILDLKEYQSKIGIGRSGPETLEHNNITYPYGEPQMRTPIIQSSFANDEFVIYDPRYYRMRYLIQIKKTSF